MTGPARRAEARAEMPPQLVCQEGADDHQEEAVDAQEEVELRLAVAGLEAVGDG